MIISDLVFVDDIIVPSVTGGTRGSAWVTTYGQEQYAFSSVNNWPAIDNSSLRGFPITIINTLDLNLLVRIT
ncbi:hypothetical protein Xen7305DRAFT_00047520 [Xenococcus sp. PCC 7305]|nr:hypothetical protein Xen7305DRAFT_00047520 [Xenococcus sp. PCC 7305]